MLSIDGRLDSIPLTPDGKVRKPVSTLVHTEDGSPYTEDGLHAMLRRYCLKAGVRPFGLMDVRAKGATDMYLRGMPLETIQMLMRHSSVKTTEIYIKRLLQTVSIASPNRVQVGAS
jgi:site-specific recombinase XerD